MFLDGSLPADMIAELSVEGNKFNGHCRPEGTFLVLVQQTPDRPPSSCFLHLQ
jgi:hypothetical protein